ncbi:cylicin-2-like [Salvelinus fontinalis]|uniref:cylicin-2-like n=1 Tax=Salvelinus fontinalis TaxID=8038 RepID=UPI0024858816|nr:cylicin-2-like [Salvelinus fontinalis]
MASSNVNDPSQGNSYQENYSCSESNSESSATEEESDSDAAGPRQDQEEPCRYYNSGHCRDGKRCHYRHVCKYALRGNCRYGAKCRLKHLSSSSDSDGGGGRRDRRRTLSGGRGVGRERRRSSSGGRGGSGRKDRKRSLSVGRGGGGRRDRRRSLSGGRGGGGRSDRRRSLSGGRGGGGRRDRRRSSTGGRGGGGRRDRRRSLSGGRGGGGRRDRRRSLSGGRGGGGGRRDRRRSLSGGRGGGGSRNRRRSLSEGRGGGGRRDRRRSLSGGKGGGRRRDRRRSLSGGRGGGGRRDRRRSLSGGRGGSGRERRRSSSGVRRGDRARERSSSREAQRDFSGPYKWQLEDGHGWKDIANDHILEGQYSQPNIKGINIYNTPYGEVSIDFKAMRVRGKKNLRVRRLDGQQTEWIWFYSSSKCWAKYGEKDSKGNPGPIQSSEIEQKFQRNRNGSLTFNIGSDTFEIQFRQMRQVNGKRKRKVVRRPKYQPPQSGSLIGRVTSAFQRVKMSPAGQSESPEWQFGGKSGRWYTFKDSADIEDQYQQDFHGSMSFTVNGQAYKLDFSAMKQTNQSTRMTRNIRRV